MFLRRLRVRRQLVNVTSVAGHQYEAPLAVIGLRREYAGAAAHE
jgi:hypothetical protein